MSKPLLLARRLDGAGPNVPTKGLLGLFAAEGLHGLSRVVVSGVVGSDKKELVTLTSIEPNKMASIKGFSYVKAELRDAVDLLREVHAYVD